HDEIRSFLNLCIEKSFLEPIELIPNHHRAINADRMNYNTMNPLLVVAIDSMKIEAVSLLLSKGARPVPLALIQAAKACHHVPGSTNPTCNPRATEMLRLLLEMGADPNAPDRSGRETVAALHHAAHAGCPDAIRLLLAAGADPIARYNPDFSSTTPLYRACALLQVEAVEILLKHGADPTLRGPWDYSVLHAVARSVAVRPRSDVRKLISLLLLREPSLLESRDHRRTRTTPLILAFVCGNFVTGVELLNVGADPSARCNQGRTALHWLAASNPENVSDAEIEAAVALMLKAGVDPLVQDADELTAMDSATGRNRK
ncbi:hypothetical protein HDU96_004807, partial [Phlyctochytrium bullatum]